MLKNKVTTDKRIIGMNITTTNSSSSGENDETSHLPKQAKSSYEGNDASIVNVTIASTSSPSSSATNPRPVYPRSRSKSSVSYAETKKSPSLNRHSIVTNVNSNAYSPQQPTTNLGSSLINAFQVPQNLAQALPQVFPNLNMSSLPDYLPQLPSVSMPAMPNITIPNLTMPSMPSLSIPSMPNISMPMMPSIPNINIPSFSDIMNFPGRKNIKSWNEICSAVRDSRKRFTDICPSIPFSFNFCYDKKREKLRIYFLSSHNQSETTLFYCDVPLVHSNEKELDHINSTIFEIDEELSSILPSFESNKTGDQSTSSPSLTKKHTNIRQKQPIDRSSTDPPPPPDDDDGDRVDDGGSGGTPELSETEDNEYNMDVDVSKSSFSSSDSSSDSFMPTKTNLNRNKCSIGSSTGATATNYDSLQWRPLVTMNRNLISNDDLLSPPTPPTLIPATPLSQSNETFVQKKQAKNEHKQMKNNNNEKQQQSSREEDLILQRKRILFNGIVSYDFHPKAARFIYTVKNMLYWFDDLDIIAHHQQNDDVNNSNAQTLDLNVSSSSSSMSSSSSFFFSSIPSPPYFPHKLVTNSYVKMNASMCPYNPDLVAYIADNDLWVCDLISCKEMRLTSTDYTKTAIMAGRPSFVMQEEFSRFNGFWWRPPFNDQLPDIYTILCEFVDESEVEIVSISGSDGSSEFHRFPKAGMTNAMSTLKMVHFSLNDLRTLTKHNFQQRYIEIQDLPIKLEDIYPDYEYLVRCDWYSWDVIWSQLLNRHQNNLVIVFISISGQFPPQIIYEERRHDHWFNCHDIFYFYQNYSEQFQTLNIGNRVKFLWSSEQSGYRHLYNVMVEIVGNPPSDKSVVNNITSNNSQALNSEEDYYEEEEEKEKKEEDNNKLLRAEHDLVQLESSSTCSEKSNETRHCVKLVSKLIYNQQITNGNWEVSESAFWVDEANDLVYFIGNRDSPLEFHLYVVSPSLSTRAVPRRLTKEDYTHSRITFDPEFRFCIDFQSNLTIPPFAYLHQVLMPEHVPHMVSLEPIYFFLNLVEGVSFEESIDFYDKVQSLGPTPQLFEYKLKSGELIFGFLFKPDFMEPGVKYPVLLEIYGGPEVQLVSKAFKDVRQHRRHLIASEGYVVVGFDSRGSKHRGVDFERHIYKRLGQVEIHDQVEALQWLAENTDFIDMSRVAIHGWSYGGYLTLMALAQRPDIFKCAIAGAPVTDWMLYDTGYTERYMGLPDENETGYKMSNVLSYTKHFPDEYNRLLIIHGLMDENVHFSHTAQLINCLISLGKPYNLNIFPLERHSLRKMNSSEHYEATLLYYLQQNL